MAIIGFIVLIIFLEALTDSFEYWSWTKGRYGKLKHLTQLLVFATIYIFSKVTPYPLISIETVYLIIGYVGLRYGLFDLLYINISNDRQPGKTDIFDYIFNKAPILNNPILRLLVAFASIYFFKITKLLNKK